MIPLTETIGTNPLDFAHLAPDVGHMSVSEAARTDLYNALSKAIGPDNTETLMGAVAWYTLDEVATKGDLEALRSEMRADISELRSEIARLKAELQSEISGVKAELHSEISALQKTISSWMLTLTVAMIGAIAGVGFLT